MATRRQRVKTVYRNFSRSRTYRKKGFGVALSPNFLIGAAASFLPVNVPPIANTAIAAVAVAPIRLPGNVKMIAQGYMMGKIIQQFVGNPLAGVTGQNQTTNGGWY
jgi:hypothetical protein